MLVYLLVQLMDLLSYWSEKNFYGTGRSLDVLVNTSSDKNQYKLITSDRLSYENDADISYSINYKQLDFSKQVHINLILLLQVL